MQKIVYFTVGTVPTPQELADIETMNLAAAAPYEVLVVNGSANAEYGETYRLIPCDFVAGTVPDNYAEIAVIAPEDMGKDELAATDTIVSDGSSVTVLGAAGSESIGSASAYVDDSELVGVRLTESATIVSDGAVFEVTGGTVMLSVANNVVSAAFVADEEPDPEPDPEPETEA